MTKKENDNILKDLGGKIRKARELARLTQAEAAKAAGVNVSYYAQIERGEVNPSYEKLQAIAKVVKMKSLDMS